MSPHLLPALRALPEPTAVSLPFFPNLRSEIRLGAWGVHPVAVSVPFGPVSCRCFFWQVHSCLFATVDMSGCFCDLPHYPVSFSSASTSLLVLEAGWVGQFSE